MNTQIFKYNENPVTFMTGDATMVSATQMARPFKKVAKDWLKTSQTKEFLDILSKGRIIPLADLVQVKKGGRTPGTWFHEDVAIEFARWLSPAFAIWCNDRIKELMKFGVTATTQRIDDILGDPDNAIKVLTALKNERRKSAVLEDQKRSYQSENTRLLNLKRKQDAVMNKMRPKVEYVDTVLSSKDTYTATQLAKELGLTARVFNERLHEYKVQFLLGDQWLLYKRYQNRGYTKTRTFFFNRKRGDVGSNTQTVWTERGRQFVHGLLEV